MCNLEERDGKRMMNRVVLVGGTKMTNYHIVLYAESNGVKILFNDYSKENITFEELKTSILRRLGNVDSVNRINRDKVKAKQIITNSTSIKDMTEKINFETELHLDVREV